MSYPCFYGDIINNATNINNLLVQLVRPASNYISIFIFHFILNCNFMFNISFQQIYDPISGLPRRPLMVVDV